MVYCFFHFDCAILIIAGKSYEYGVDLQALFLWSDAPFILSRIRTYERSKAYADETQETVQASGMPAFDEQSLL